IGAALGGREHDGLVQFGVAQHVVQQLHLVAGVVGVQQALRDLGVLFFLARHFNALGFAHHARGPAGPRAGQRRRAPPRPASSAYSRLCVILVCFSFWPAISMRWGSRIMRAASLATVPSSVAENSSVWRSCGRRSMMVSMSSMKPMSSMRSASSSTSVCTVF